MNPAVIFLAIIVIWPTGDGSPSMGHVVAPNMATCQAAVAAIKASLEAKPDVRFVAGQCVEFDRGEKA